jgi:hypothetical protein
MAVLHPALISPDRASSRAGSLPHLIGSEHQIRVPQVMGQAYGFVPDKYPLWEPSLLAMALVHPALISPDRASSRASAAPTGYGSGIRICARQIPHVGVSLLAMAVVHPALMLPDRASSRASSAPTGYGSGIWICARQISPVGVSLLAMVVVHPALMLPDRASSRASSAPTGYGSGIRICARKIPPVGAELARDDGRASTMDLRITAKTPADTPRAFHPRTDGIDW